MRRACGDENVPAEQRKEFGLILNDFKQFAEARYEVLRDSSLADII
mgnify:CR=1 FL=1